MVYLMVTNPLTTTWYTFGVFQKYLFHPSYDPDLVVNPGDLLNLSPCTPLIEPNSTEHKLPWPFSNMSIWRLVKWMNTGSCSKSEGEANRLVNDILKAPDFHAKDIQSFNTHHLKGFSGQKYPNDRVRNKFQCLYQLPLITTLYHYIPR